MAERIYTRAERGRLEPLEEKPFSTEDELQALIAEYPELLDGEQIRPGDPRRWILISREKGIAETSDAAARWAIDHLIIDQDAVPTLTEVKRGSNPEIRRTIVGQMLEYAAHAAQTWTADELRRTFEKSTNERGLDPSHELATLLQADGEADADRFWRDVSTNLAARRLRLLFVADDIPDPLERVVEFLNGQMPGIEVLAVEIKQFRGKSTQTLVPRVIGRTAASSEPGTARGTTGKTHIALALGLAACQKGYRVRFTTAAALVHELLEARDDKRLLRLQKQLAKQDLLIVDELGYVPLSKTGSELLFEIFSQRYERASKRQASLFRAGKDSEAAALAACCSMIFPRAGHARIACEVSGAVSSGRIRPRPAIRISSTTSAQSISGS